MLMTLTIVGVTKRRSSRYLGQELIDSIHRNSYLSRFLNLTGCSNNHVNLVEGIYYSISVSTGSLVPERQTIDAEAAPAIREVTVAVAVASALSVKAATLSRSRGHMFIQRADPVSTSSETLNTWYLFKVMFQCISVPVLISLQQVWNIFEDSLESLRTYLIPTAG